jgi:Mrp family chromosome partitioning ATPase
LIDGDISRSNTCLSEPLAEREGFTECVAGIIPLERAVLATEEPRLHFMPSGKDRVHYGDAIGAGALRPLLERCGALYDVVVIDLAPALMNAEAPVIASACDGVVLVVRAHRTRREIVRRAVAELGFAKCRVLGTVLNARRETLPRFLRERV